MAALLLTKALSIGPDPILLDPEVAVGAVLLPAFPACFNALVVVAGGA